jgi:hypothetical protein
MMKLLSKSLPVLFLVPFTFCFLLGLNTANGEDFIPPVTYRVAPLSHTKHKC